MPSDMAIHTLYKMKGWLLKGGTPGNMKPPIMGTTSDDEDFANDSDEEFTAKLDLLHIFFDVLDNHPDKKDLFFNTITKIMETNNPDSLSKKEKKFMLDLIEEAIFAADETIPHGEA